MTTVVGCLLSPIPPTLQILVITTTGTLLCICSANVFNQFLESSYDAQMARTRNRVLVRHAMLPKTVFALGITLGSTGVLMLSLLNPLTSSLGLLNIILVYYI
jgi:protoheme IX farnesyltransferase